MAIDADRLVDRRRLKQRLTLWRVAAVLAVVGALILLIGRFGDGVVGAHVARLTVDRVIFDDVDRDRAIEALGRDGAVKAVIVRIDSPGGTVVGGEMLYRLLRRLGESKPVVAVIGEVGTSAAYMTALGADHILAQSGSITGSIGVILQTTDLTGLLDRIGVKPESVKSSPLKAQPNPLEPFTPQAREATARVVDDIYAMFTGMVEERRRLSPERLGLVTDGRVFTGRQALALGLVDALGDERDARSWLEQRHGIAASLPARDVEIGGPERRLQTLLRGLWGKALISEWLSLDGLVSVWHPAK